MATVEIKFTFSDDSSKIEEFEGCSGVGGEVSDYADDEAAELAEDCDGNKIDVECTGWEIVGSDCSDYEDMEEPDDFDNLDEWGEYCHLVNKHGEAFVLRHADWSGHDNMDAYHGCWASEEEYAQDFYESCYGSDGDMHCYIDWERYARDILMDYSVYEGIEGYHIWCNH